MFLAEGRHNHNFNLLIKNNYQIFFFFKLNEFFDDLITYI